jgi:hypothetical protein
MAEKEDHLVAGDAVKNGRHTVVESDEDTVIEGLDPIYAAKARVLNHAVNLSQVPC